MPLINQVGRKAWPVRFLTAGMYALLALGAATMAYPFLLMIAMATTGLGEYQEFRVVPRYWISDAALFKKYLLDTVPINRAAWSPTEEMPVGGIAVWFGKEHWFLARDIQEEDFAEVVSIPELRRMAMASDLREFIADICPSEFRIPCALFDRDCELALQPEYYAWLRQKYGSLDAINQIYPDNAATWEELGLVVESAYRQPHTSPRDRDWQAFLKTLRPERVGLIEVDTAVSRYLAGKELPADYDGPRDASGRIARWRIPFDDLYAGKLGQAHKTAFLRAYAPTRYLQIHTPLAASAWKMFLERKQKDPAAVLTERIPAEEASAGLWSQFVQSECPIEALRLLRPEDTWRSFLSKRYSTIAALNSAYGTRYVGFDDVKLPWAAFKYDCFLREKDGLRRRYVLHNFTTVLSFVTVHGSALRVTLIYILLLLVGTLTVNPLAAYAMSRFRLKETYHILIFLLATMAFPGEVLMIPGFLMIKSFPWGQFLVVAVAGLGFFLLAKKLGRKIPLLLSATVAVAVVAFLAGWALPRAAAHFNVSISASLMNTFWALVLPGLANGYGIFLLKGFFDSLPPELYEAGLIDGASELRMFWQITLPLCRPIMAVMALGAFGAGYGAFMHAFLICQDPKMWTFMVFLYEFQQIHTVPLVMASLVVAAIPTLLVFLFCQNMILRGIVIPAFK